ncbi:MULTISPECIES: phytanoyl-CoA dioxygenase family protein [unclassified Francisella]|uniref:phytanoyl-CoA dioxygenase family protein n=1 Tax=unclassified Francisella TaxID=2610885 RepID=UPI002E2F3961|nr:MULTISPECIES: phytanoyl-CoA dioxygenase family protein [unclassified Francisella]MED7819508.1 phytanoyl-CoA dioxygenase family protein [Francisella sp. 19S2-4]MED7830297.1 phytanoyl-CoA dioxygenase family protein [Francisella sp. 19S2-10]
MINNQQNNKYKYGENQPGNNSVSYQDYPQLQEIKKKLPLRVLSEDDFKHWQTYGYVVIKNAISKEDAKQTADFLWEFSEMTQNDKSTWKPNKTVYRMQELNGSGMLECYHHPLLWNNRQNQRVYDAFVDIWDREDLWVTIDRANLSLPIKYNQKNFSGFLHWDADSTLKPLPVNVQGVLALSDTTLSSGGFQCVHELFKNFSEWEQQQPADRDPFTPNIETVPYPAKPILVKAGDLIIFNAMLLHGIRPNTSDDEVRLAQYISMTPAEPTNQAIKNWRVKSFEEKTAPDGFAFEGDPREWEKNKYSPAKLNSLGEKLLGLKNY